jgi:hypothetical protein
MEAERTNEERPRPLRGKMWRDLGDQRADPPARVILARCGPLHKERPMATIDVKLRPREAEGLLSHLERFPGDAEFTPAQVAEVKRKVRYQLRQQQRAAS